MYKGAVVFSSQTWSSPYFVPILEDQAGFGLCPGKQATHISMPSALVALSVVEVVEQIVSFFPFFEQAAPLAGVCISTRNVLCIPLQEHAHNVRLYDEHRTAVWLEQVQQTQLAVARDYWWISDAIGVWHVNDGT